MSDINLITIPERNWKQLMNRLDRIDARSERVDNKLGLDSKYMTLSQVAKYIKFSKGHVAQSLKHEIGFIQRDKRVLFDIADVDAWVERNKYNRQKD